jgi:hypothetical protein
MPAVALRVRTARRSGSDATDVSRTLIATSRQSFVSRAIHLAHAARAKRRRDFICAEASASNERLGKWLRVWEMGHGQGSPFTGSARNKSVGDFQSPGNHHHRMRGIPWRCHIPLTSLYRNVTGPPGDSGVQFRSYVISTSPPRILRGWSTEVLS